MTNNLRIIPWPQAYIKRLDLCSTFPSAIEATGFYNYASLSYASSALTARLFTLNAAYSNATSISPTDRSEYKEKTDSFLLLILRKKRLAMHPYSSHALEDLLYENQKTKEKKRISYSRLFLSICYQRPPVLSSFWQLRDGDLRMKLLRLLSVLCLGEVLSGSSNML